MDYFIFEETSKEDGNTYYSGTGHSGGGGVLKGTLIGIAAMLLLAFVLGVGVPGAVWGFFGKVILVVVFLHCSEKYLANNVEKALKAVYKKDEE